MAVRFDRSRFGPVYLAVTWTFVVFSWGFVYQIVGISMDSIERFLRGDALPVTILLLLIVTCAFLRREAGLSVEQWSEDALTLCVVLVYPQEIAAALSGAAALLVAVSQLASPAARARGPLHGGAWYILLGEVAFHGGLMAFVTLAGSAAFRALYGDAVVLRSIGLDDLWRLPLVFATVYLVRLGVLFVHSWSRGLPLEEFGRSARSLRSVRSALPELSNLLLGVSMALVYSTLGLPVFVALGGAFISAVALHGAEARARRELQARVIELRVLNAVGRALADAKSRDAVLHALAERGRTLFGADSLVLYATPGSVLSDESGADSAIESLGGNGSGGAGQDGRRLAEWCAANERTLRLESVTRRAGAYGIEISETPPESWIGVPLAIEGRTQGVLSAASARRAAFAEQHEELLGALGRQAMVALHNVRLVELATVDSLTGLVSARHLRERLAEEFDVARATGRPLSVVMLDVDRFKSVNDDYGHEVGNEILRYLAKVMVGKLRETDIAARYGGEEFTVLLPATPAARAVDVAERLRAAFDTFPAETSVGPLAITVSVGVATYPGMRVATGEALMAAADAALYESKRAGRNRVTEANGTASDDR
jgi:diguanylate cyclase (GGDEF)-like protein